MIAAGEVGAVFIVKDEASPVLKRLMDQFNALQGVIDKTKESLATIKFPPGLNASINTMASNLEKAGIATQNAAGTWSGSFAKMDESVAKTQAAVARLAADIKGLGAETKGIGTISAGGRPSIRNGYVPHGSSGPGFHANPGSVPVGPGHVNATGDGWGPLIAGLGVGYATLKVLAAGGRLTNAQGQLESMGGVSADQLQAATNAAQAATRSVQGTTISDNLAGIREMMGVMPNLDEAMKGYAPVMRVAKQLENLTHKPAEETFQTLAKFVELRGGGINPTTRQLDPDRFQREVEAAGAAIKASGGLINDRQLYQYTQTAGPMARLQADPIKFYQGAITAIMDMGGFRAGTATAALGRQFLGGKMSFPTAEADAADGILIPGMFHKSGTGTFVEKGGVRGEAIIKNEGIVEWLNQIVVPALASKGITKTGDVMQEMIRIFGTNTGQRIGTLYAQNGAQVARDADLVAKAAAEMRSYEIMTSTDYAGNLKNVAAAWENVMESIGSVNTPNAIAVMQAFANSMNAVAGAALAHPQAGAAITGDAVVGATGVVGGWISKYLINKLFGTSFTWSGLAESLGIKSMLGPLAVAYGVKQAADVADPEGNFWGLTKPIDNWFRRNASIGWGGSMADNKLANSLYDSGYGYDGHLLNSEMSREAARGHAMSRPMPPPKVNVTVFVNGVLAPSRSTSTTNGTDNMVGLPLPDNGGRDY